jgi:hypothetical protein
VAWREDKHGPSSFSNGVNLSGTDLVGGRRQASFSSNERSRSRLSRVLAREPTHTPNRSDVRGRVPDRVTDLVAPVDAREDREADLDLVQRHLSVVRVQHGVILSAAHRGQEGTPPAGVSGLGVGAGLVDGVVAAEW